MVRSNNEDAALVLHATELRDAAADDWAVIGLADGMGGTAAGEVAAAITMQTLRRSVLRFSPLSRLQDDLGPRPSIDDSKAIADCLGRRLREANQAVYVAGRDEDRRGMGCTAEVVIVNGQRLVVGHVGDSRTYHFTRGELRQLTRDHTYVATLVEQGVLSADEAQMHPRRGELMQAIGGRADVAPEMIHATFSPGDWLIVCSDGLTAQSIARDDGLDSRTIAFGRRSGQAIGESSESRGRGRQCHSRRRPRLLAHRKRRGPINCRQTPAFAAR